MDAPLGRAVAAFVASPVRGLPILFSQLRESAPSPALRALRVPGYLDALVSLLGASDPRASAGAALALAWHGGISRASDYCVLAHPGFFGALHRAYSLAPASRSLGSSRLGHALLALVRVYAASPACAEALLYDPETMDFISAWAAREPPAHGRTFLSAVEDPSALVGEILLAILRHCKDDSDLFVLYSHGTLCRGLADRALQDAGLPRSLQRALRSLLLALLRSEALRPLVVAEFGDALGSALGDAFVETTVASFAAWTAEEPEGALAGASEGSSERNPRAQQPSDLESEERAVLEALEAKEARETLNVPIRSDTTVLSQQDEVLGP